MQTFSLCFGLCRRPWYSVKMERKIIVTHDGGFHADDVCAVAALLLFLKGGAEVVRTRERSTIAAADFALDVGDEYLPERNRFDHHQPNGAGVRENGIPYAAFGLVWKKFGEALCGGSRSAAARLDAALVSPLDAHDNGVPIIISVFPGVHPYGLSEMIKACTPTWEEEKRYDERFREAVGMAEKILLREITKVNAVLRAETFVSLEYERAPDKRLIILPADYPWKETLARFPEPLFVVHLQDAVWYLACVRDDPKGFQNRKDLPAEWAGLRDGVLAQVTGVSDAIFCHRNRFMAVAGSKEGAVALAKLALNYRRHS